MNAHYTKYLTLGQTYWARWRLYWLARHPREQKMLLAWAAAATGALLYFGLYAPLSAQINRLKTQVPHLENQLMAMRGSQPVITASKTAAALDLRSATFAELSNKNISADVRSISTQSLELRSNMPNVAEALQLANELRHRVQATVSAIEIKSAASSVSLVMVLERQ